MASSVHRERSRDLRRLERRVKRYDGAAPQHETRSRSNVAEFLKTWRNGTEMPRGPMTPSGPKRTTIATLPQPGYQTGLSPALNIFGRETPSAEAGLLGAEPEGPSQKDLVWWKPADALAPRQLSMTLAFGRKDFSSPPRQKHLQPLLLLHPLPPQASPYSVSPVETPETGGKSSHLLPPLGECFCQRTPCSSWYRSGSLHRRPLVLHACHPRSSSSPSFSGCSRFLALWGRVVDGGPLDVGDLSHWRAQLRPHTAWLRASRIQPRARDAGGATGSKELRELLVLGGCVRYATWPAGSRRCSDV
ncbi:hypothetical protein EYF80_026725 [Liparis tanakae]|uniref:Uncharacterized protein n=1 Tax=Liparis tanakae TaxID=230148 RepID=A0A4Z2HBB3_9TELE|nr:hypothetical protein EYF80_026725 [Liparis tanakae]